MSHRVWITVEGKMNCVPKMRDPGMLRSCYDFMRLTFVCTVRTHTYW